MRLLFGGEVVLHYLLLHRAPAYEDRSMVFTYPKKDCRTLLVALLVQFYLQ